MPHVPMLFARIESTITPEECSVWKISVARLPEPKSSAPKRPFAGTQAGTQPDSAVCAREQTAAQQGWQSPLQLAGTCRRLGH